MKSNVFRFILLAALVVVALAGIGTPAMAQDWVNHQVTVTDEFQMPVEGVNLIVWYFTEENGQGWQLAAFLETDENGFAETGDLWISEGAAYWLVEDDDGEWDFVIPPGPIVEIDYPNPEGPGPVEQIEIEVQAE